MKDIMEFKGLFEYEIAYLFSIQSQMIGIMAELTNKAGDNDLKSTLEEQKKSIMDQRDRLVKIGEKRNFDLEGVKAGSIQALGEEALDLINRVKTEKLIQDSLLILLIQRMYHVSLGGFGTASTHSRLLDDDDVTQLLKTCVEETKHADEKLSKMAMSWINQKASKQTEPSNFFGRHG